MSCQSSSRHTILSGLNIALSLHDFAGAILSHRRVYEALVTKQLDYYIWVAVKKVSDNWKKYVPLPYSFTVYWTWLRDGWTVAREECLTRTVHQLVSGTADRIIYILPLNLCCLKLHPDPRTCKCDLRPYIRTVLWAGGPSKTCGRELLDRKRAWHVWTTSRSRRSKK